MPLLRRPQGLVDSQVTSAAMMHDGKGFQLLYGTWPILLVCIPPGDKAFEQGLHADQAPARVLAFQTEVAAPLTAFASGRSAQGGVSDRRGQLRELLLKSPGFAMSLRRRPDSEAPFAERVSVGRASNKDVVLRHKSVSKFHAWFETDTSGALYVVDAESKNLTHLNAAAVVPKTKMLIAPGDFVRFGSIETFLFEPADYWSFVREASRV
jgi:hypothetical protein